ncbi:MAG: type IV toxin-antitoxin system AbiEi family antitoxin domain-containing protein [Promethearchaeota archaeon]
MGDIELKKIFQKNKWYLSREHLIKLGFNQNSIKNMVGNKQILKITNSLYRWKNIDLGGNDDYLDISHIEPKGVFCLYTAMNFYQLTTYVSTKYYLAIPRERWIRKGLEQYPIVVKKWKDAYFDLGIDLIKLGRFTLRIYNLEKTVCDCVKYRKELGLNILKEVLTAYFRLKNKNLRKLSMYAETLGVAKVLKEYAGMIL